MSNNKITYIEKKKCYIRVGWDCSTQVNGMGTRVDKNGTPALVSHSSSLRH